MINPTELVQIQDAYPLPNQPLRGRKRGGLAGQRPYLGDMILPEELRQKPLLTRRTFLEERKCWMEEEKRSIRRTRRIVIGLLLALDCVAGVVTAMLVTAVLI